MHTQGSILLNSPVSDSRHGTSLLSWAQRCSRWWLSTNACSVAVLHPCISLFSPPQLRASPRSGTSRSTSGWTTARAASWPPSCSGTASRTARPRCPSRWARGRWGQHPPPSQMSSRCHCCLSHPPLTLDVLLAGGVRAALQVQPAERPAERADGAEPQPGPGLAHQLPLPALPAARAPRGQVCWWGDTRWARLSTWGHLPPAPGRLGAFKQIGSFKRNH